MGVVGVGHLGRRHAQVMVEVEGVTLTGIYDNNADTAEDVGGMFSCRVFGSLDAMLEEVDAVSVVVPTDLHYEVAGKVMEAGKHVLIEKPITDKLEEADDLISIAREKNLVLQVGHVERFNPAFRLPLKFIEKPLFVESHRLSPFVERGTEVDVILDLMIHDIDLTLTLMEDDSTDIWAVGVPVVTPTADISNTRIMFPENRAASLTASRISNKRMRKIRIFQRDTYISMDLLERRSEMYRIEWKEGKPMLKEKVFVGEDSTNPLADEISSFAKSIREDLPPRVTGEQAKRALYHAIKIRECMLVPRSEDRGDGGSTTC
jgi:predicted dehydrogenase